MQFGQNELYQLMWRCIHLARLSPTELRKPHVGALMLNASGHIIGEGYNSFVSSTNYTLHAERMAILEALEKVKGEQLKGTTLVTTLEPCIDNYKQIFKSCSTLIAESGIEHVVIGFPIYSPNVLRREGIKALDQRGVQITIFTALKKIIGDELMPPAYTQAANYGLSDQNSAAHITNVATIRAKEITSRVT